jgi:hypothetical protein
VQSYSYEFRILGVSVPNYCLVLSIWGCTLAFDGLEKPYHQFELQWISIMPIVAPQVKDDIICPY